MSSQRRILILGGTGFVGRAVFTALDQNENFEPVVASRHAVEGNPKQLRLDVVDPVSLKKAMLNFDGVVNCVTGDARVIVDGARNLAEAVRDRQIPVIHLSSMAAYGHVAGRVTEDNPLKGDLGAYSAAKAAAETLLRDGAQRLVVLRPGVIYGRGSEQWTRRVSRWLLQGRLGDLGPAGDGVCNLVHIDDTVRVIASALCAETLQDGRAFNLAHPSPPTWNEYFIEFARALRAVPVKRLTSRRMLWEAKMAYPRKALELALKKSGINVDLDPMGPSYWALWKQNVRLDVARAEAVFGANWTDWKNALRTQ